MMSNNHRAADFDIPTPTEEQWITTLSWRINQSDLPLGPWLNGEGAGLDRKGQVKILARRGSEFLKTIVRAVCQHDFERGVKLQFPGS